MTNSKVNHVLVNAQVPTRKVHGHEFPYYKVLMDNGTPCDLLANKPRTTSVLYMCNPRSSNEVRLLSSPRRRYNVTSVSKCLGSCPNSLVLGQSWWKGAEVARTRILVLFRKQTQPESSFICGTG